MYPDDKQELLGPGYAPPNSSQSIRRPLPRQYHELNFVITGDASVGKRSLVQKFHKILQDNSLLPPELHIFIDEGSNIQELSIAPYDYNPNNAARIPKYQLNFSLPLSNNATPKYDYRNHYPRKRQIDGAIFAFDLVNQNSLQNINKLLLDLWQQKALRTENIILVGNKSDPPRQIANTNINTLVMQYVPKFPIDYYKTSASTGKNVKAVFERLIQKHFYFAKYPPAL